MLCRCPVCRSIIPGWDGKGGGVIGLKVRAIFSFWSCTCVVFYIRAFVIHFSRPKLARWSVLDSWLSTQDFEGRYSNVTSFLCQCLMKAWGFELHPIPGTFREIDFANVFGLKFGGNGAVKCQWISTRPRIQYAFFRAEAPMNLCSQRCFPTR